MATGRRLAFAPDMGQHTKSALLGALTCCAAPSNLRFNDPALGLGLKFPGFLAVMNHRGPVIVLITGVAFRRVDQPLLEFAFDQAVDMRIG